MEPSSVAKKESIKKDERSIPEEGFRSDSVSSVSSVKSTSSEFSIEDPYQLDINDHGSFAIDNYPSSNAPVTPSSTSTLEIPPSVQLMEQSADASGYRIPSHVFATNKSGTPNQEWSTASNESLFSIHTGNMSFTRDQFNWLLKSGELGLYTPGDIRKSGELPPPSPRIVLKSTEQKPATEQMSVVPPETSKSGEEIIASHFKTSSAPPAPTVNRPADVEVKSPGTVNDVAIIPDLTIGNKKDEPKTPAKVKQGRSAPSDEIPHSNRTSVSHHSDASGQSFAFPVLAEIDRDKSVNSGQSRADQKITSNHDQEAPKTPTSAPPAPTSTFGSWFSYVSCCSRR